MAKKTKTTYKASSERTELSKFCAFWGIVIAAILFVTSGIINLCRKFISNIAPKTASLMGSICSIFSLLASIALLIGVAIPAWRYVRGKTKGWKILYWVCLVIYALGVVFGFIVL